MKKILVAAVSVIGFILNTTIAAASVIEAVKLNGGLFLGALFYSPTHLLGVLLPLSFALGIAMGGAFYFSVVYRPTVR